MDGRGPAINNDCARYPAAEDALENGTLAIIAQVAMGIGLAACAGLRAFLPMLVVAIAGYMKWVPLAGPFEWLGTAPAIVVFGVAVAVEVLADKVPLVDNALDMVQTLVKPAAGAVLGMAVLTDLDPLPSAVLGLVAGGASAGVVHVAKAKVRLLSSFTTAGLGNPILSAGEDVLSFAGSIVALAMPLVLLAVVVTGLVLVGLALRRFRTRAERFSRP